MKNSNGILNKPINAYCSIFPLIGFDNEIHNNHIIIPINEIMGNFPVVFVPESHTTQVNVPPSTSRTRPLMSIFASKALYPNVQLD